eukprot:s2258_g6.t1
MSHSHVRVGWLMHDTKHGESIARDGRIKAYRATSDKYDKALAQEDGLPVVFTQASVDGLGGSIYPRNLLAFFEEPKRRLLWRPEHSPLLPDPGSSMYLVSIHKHNQIVQLFVLFALANDDKAWCQECFQELDPFSFSPFHFDQEEMCWKMLTKTPDGSRLIVNVVIAADVPWPTGGQVSFTQDLENPSLTHAMLIAPWQKIGHAYCPCLRKGPNGLYGVCKNWFHDYDVAGWMARDQADRNLQYAAWIKAWRIWQTDP